MKSSIRRRVAASGSRPCAAPMPITGTHSPDDGIGRPIMGAGWAASRPAESTTAAVDSHAARPIPAILHDQKVKGSVTRTQRPPLTIARNDELAPWCLSRPKLTSGPLKMSW